MDEHNADAQKTQTGPAPLEASTRARPCLSATTRAGSIPVCMHVSKRREELKGVKSKASNNQLLRAQHREGVRRDQRTLPSVTHALRLTLRLAHSFTEGNGQHKSRQHSVERYLPTRTPKIIEAGRTPRGPHYSCLDVLILCATERRVEEEQTRQAKAIALTNQSPCRRHQTYAHVHHRQKRKAHDITNSSILLSSSYAATEPTTAASRTRQARSLDQA